MTIQNPANRPRALIAMSGGVDSSVAAWLMQQAGYDCTGITMRLTHNETLGQSGYQTCCSEKDIEDAAEVAFALDMPYQVLDFTADFRAICVADERVRRIVVQNTRGIGFAFKVQKVKREFHADQRHKADVRRGAWLKMKAFTGICFAKIIAVRVARRGVL